MNNKFYLTTPLYYVNDSPHIGHAYTQIAADTLARYKRLKGYNVLFLTGTDEHGLKMEQAARTAGLEPEPFADTIVERFKSLWKKLNITYDDFIRTTQPRHIKVVENIYNLLFKKGDVYKDTYKGWYCTPCETFFTETQLIDGKCPDCRRPVQWVEEESYFFKMSAYQNKLTEYIENHPDFIEPISRRNEIIGFIKQGLRDISVSRTTFRWGIPLPFDTSHVAYVWVDALINYISALGYSIDKNKFDTFWPADVHLIGKDILKFHAVIWPCLLLACGIEPPKKVFAHGWWTIEGQKMSKSKGNVIDPNTYADTYGEDSFRYFLLREVPFGNDGDFSHDSFRMRFNGDLANDLGNLVHRSLNMLDKYCQRIIPEPNDFSPEDKALQDALLSLEDKIDVYYQNLEFHSILTDIWEVINRLNKYIEEMAPWKLNKLDKERLKTVLYTLLDSLRIITLYIYPFVPSTAEKIWHQLGMSGELTKISMDKIKLFELKPGTKINDFAPLFPRIE